MTDGTSSVLKTNQLIVVLVLQVMSTLVLVGCTSGRSATSVPKVVQVSQSDNQLLDPGQIQFDYDPESNGLRAVICQDKRSQKFDEIVGAALRRFRNSKNSTRSGTGELAEERIVSFQGKPCVIVWGLAQNEIGEFRANGARNIDNRNQQIFSAFRDYFWSQIPSTGLTVGAASLAMVTASSSFHDIVHSLETLHWADAAQALQSTDPQHFGWTAVSLALFASSRVVSAATIKRRIGIGVQLKESLAIAKFSKVYSRAFDKSVAEFQAGRANKIDQDPVAFDGFLQLFSMRLNEEIMASGIKPQVVLDALLTMNSTIETALFEAKN